MSENVINMSMSVLILNSLNSHVYFAKWNKLCTLLPIICYLPDDDDDVGD